MTVGIAYDGVLWSGGKSGKERRELHNKVAYTSFDSAAKYRERKEGLLASRFHVKGIELRIRNGGGAGWVQGFGNAATPISMFWMYFTQTRRCFLTYRIPIVASF